jgi:hypothetical protein
MRLLNPLTIWQQKLKTLCNSSCRTRRAIAKSEAMEQRALLSAVVEFLPTTGTVVSEPGGDVLTVSPNEAVDFTVSVTSDGTDNLTGFQLNFGNSAAQLTVDNWITNTTLWPAESDSMLDTGNADSFVASGTFSTVTAPPQRALGTFTVTAPAAGGDFTLSVDAVTGGPFDTAFLDSSFQRATIADFGNLIIRVSTPTIASSVDIAATSLNIATASSMVSFEFDSDVIGFDESDITPTGGTLSDFTAINGHSYTAMFTANSLTAR